MKWETYQSCPGLQIHVKLVAKAETRSRDRWLPPIPTIVCTNKWHIHGELCGLKKNIYSML